MSLSAGFLIGIADTTSNRSIARNAMPESPDTTDLRELWRRHMEVCPNCGTELPPATCCFTYSEWRCWGCGANLDSRVVMPKLVLRCENEFPEYDRHPGDPVHPLACSCTGRGWYEITSTVLAERTGEMK